MLKSLLKPSVTLTGDKLIRRMGWFYRSQIELSAVKRIAAVVSDSVTHEEVMIGFFDEFKDRVWISEFDANFQQVMQLLHEIFPGLKSSLELCSSVPFDGTSLVLWEDGGGTREHWVGEH